MNYEMLSAAPAAKVVAATVAAFLSPILIFLLKKTGMDLPDGYEAIVSAMVTAILVFGAGYLKAPASGDGLKAAPPQ